MGALELASFLASLSPLWPRYDELTESVEEYVLDMLRDQLNRRQPIDNVSRNLLRLLTATCGYKEVRLLAVQRLEMWLQNPKVRCVGETEFVGVRTVMVVCSMVFLASLQLTRPAQDLLMSVCMNCNSHGPEDMDAISHLIKIRLKPKVLLNHYMLCIRCVASWGSSWGDRPVGSGGAWPVPLTCSALVSRELLNAHKDNLGTTIKFVIFNELSNARNPNNMQILYTVLQHSSELAPKVRTLSTGQPMGLCPAEAGNLWSCTGRNSWLRVGRSTGSWFLNHPCELTLWRRKRLVLSEPLNCPCSSLVQPPWLGSS